MPAQTTTKRTLATMRREVIDAARVLKPLTLGPFRVLSDRGVVVPLEDMQRLMDAVAWLESEEKKLASSHMTGGQHGE